MKTIISKAKNVRGSAQKARIPSEVIKGMMVDDAIAVLTYLPKKAAGDVLKVVKTGRADAIHNFDMLPENLRIANVRVDKAFKLKRIKAGSKGMANVINKHYCHILVEIEDISDRTDTKSEMKAGKKTAKTKKVDTNAKAKKSTSASKKSTPSKGGAKKSK